MDTIAPAALLPDLKTRLAGRARAWSNLIGAAQLPWRGSSEVATTRQRPKRLAEPRRNRDQRDMALAETPILPQLWPQY
jgi:hypothetical protein